MSAAVNYLDEPCICPDCGSEDVVPQSNYGSDVDEKGRKVSVDTWKCHACGARYDALSEWVEDDES